MKKLIFISIVLSFTNSINAFLPDRVCLSQFKDIQKYDSDVIVVGGGPAGNIIVGILLDLGMPEKRITWFDRDNFKGGKLSSYPTVPANTKNKLFVKLLESCKTFAECVPNAIKELKKLDAETEYPLETIIKPFQEITECLMKKVVTVKGTLESLYFENNCWKVVVNGKTYSSFYVVLATGSHPKTLNYPEHKQKEISLDQALDRSQLKEIIKAEDTVAVIGSSHSAVLIMKFLSELKVKKIINFYKKPLQYMVDMGNWVLHGEPGLKGIAADWAKNILEKNPPANLVRLESNNETLKQTLPECTKIIYAIGFERNELPSLPENPKFEYDSVTGVIAPRLFGIGIAFPGKYVDPLGNVEHRVGLNSFMDYAQRIVPCWLQMRSLNLPSCRHIELLKSFESLFTIEVL